MANTTKTSQEQLDHMGLCIKPHTHTEQTKEQTNNMAIRTPPVMVLVYESDSLDHLPQSI